MSSLQSIAIRLCEQLHAVGSGMVTLGRPVAVRSSRGEGDSRGEYWTGAPTHGAVLFRDVTNMYDKKARFYFRDTEESAAALPKLTLRALL
jgi:hypothetical protein